MKKLHKLAAATAMALSLGGLSPYANAIGFVPEGMEVSSEMRGDALLFPVFYGRGENFYTISNNSPSWIQGHLRFRGAAWSGELLDMDIILSPGDVFVFRVADIDGDGHWELDQSLDPLNFRYSGMLSDCGAGPYLSWETPVSGAVAKSNCMDPKFKLIPLPKGMNGLPAELESASGLTRDRIDYHVHNGYIEFIGEGMFSNDMNHALMGRLIDPANAGRIGRASGQREVGNKLGSSLWAWTVRSSPANDAPFNADTNRNGTAFMQGPSWTVSDVSNALGGTGFVTLIPGQKSGVGYNAESIVNFRTNLHSHRVDNYPLDNGVIMHTEDANPVGAPNFTYLYAYDESGSQWSGYGATISNQQEGRISFNNTWGPTLADGDDYNTPDAEITVLSELRAVDGFGNDSWDNRFGGPNSIAEVEEAIRKASLRNATTGPADGGIYFGALTATGSGQTFSGFYFDNSTFDKACDGNNRTPAGQCSNSRLQTWYFAYAPTKFFYGEEQNYWRTVQAATDLRFNAANKLLGQRGYLQGAVEMVLAMPKQYLVEVWNIFENTTSGCTTSPCVSDPRFSTYEELSVFSIANIKNKLIAEGASSDISAWDMGRLLLAVPEGDNLCANVGGGLGFDPCERTFPVFIYSFDIGTDMGLAHWRPMQR